MGLTGTLHESYVHQRRIVRLADLLADKLPEAASVIDVGCGDGLLARRILEIRPDVAIRGLDVLVREGTHIPVEHFDGNTIPEADGAADVVMFVDVLHHTDDAMVLLREAVRVARKAIVIKDHTRDGFLAGPTLRFMDYVGNAHHGVRLPYNYWPKARWDQALRELGLKATAWETDLKLYPNPANLVFGRTLHFVARLEKAGGPQ